MKDSVTHLSTNSALPADLSPQNLIDLLSKDVNLLITLSPKQTSLSLLAAEFNLIIPPPGTPLVSHFPERAEPATVIPVDVPKTLTFVSSDIPPVWFSGIPHALGNNPLLVPILHAPAESFATDTSEDTGAASAVDAADKGGEGLWAGSSMGLVSGFQTLAGSRVVFAGSVSLFSNEYANENVAK
jgi:oligosaccharyltransferase complex subunit beta